MMPHLKARPVSLVRAPEGVGGELFFQKHAADRARCRASASWTRPSDPDHPRMTGIDSVEGILSCAQMNVVEFHSQNAVGRSATTSRTACLRPRPGRGHHFAMVQEAAQLVRAFLQELGLNAFLKTSGGKGLHVVVPLKPKLDWDTVKDFSHAIVTHLARTLPERFSAKSGAEEPRRHASSSTTCATAAGRPRSRPGRRARAPGWGFRCR